MVQASDPSAGTAVRPPVALIAGAGDGLGTALAQRLLPEGFQTILVARSAERLQKRAESLAHAGGRLHCRALDLRDEQAVTQLFEGVEAEFGAPEFVVYNAGAQYRESVLKTSSEMFEKVWRLSCFGGFLVGREAARRMADKGHGTIIFTGATASIRGGDGFAAFASAKFGLRARAQSMARELGPKGVHVASSVIDGAIDMPRIHKLFPGRAASLPPDGMLQPADIADAYLAVHRQKRSAWSHEIDLRPWCEKF